MSYTHYCYQCPNCLRYIHEPKNQPQAALQFCYDCDDFFYWYERYESYYQDIWHINEIKKINYK